MTHPPEPTLIAENAVLARALGAAQRRCADEAAAAAARLAALQRELAQLRRERAQMLALLGPLARALAATSPEATEPADDAAPAAACAAWAATELLICHAGCLSDGDAWRAGDRCRRSGLRCVFIGPTAPVSDGEQVRAAAHRPVHRPVHRR